MSELISTTWSISLFDQGKLNYQGSSLLPLPYEKANLLFFLLASSYPQPIRREQLCHWLWPAKDMKKAKVNLRQALSRLKKHILSHAENILSSTPEEISLNFSKQDVSIDAAELQSQEIESLDTNQLESSYSLLQQDFFGFDGLSDYFELEEWIFQQRRHFDLLKKEYAIALFRSYQHESVLEKKLTLGLQLTEQFPWEEEIHLELMKTYVLAGQTSSAINHYNLLKKNFQKELKLSPGQELQTYVKQLYQQSTESKEKEESAESLPSFTAFFQSENKFPTFAHPYVARSEQTELIQKLKADHIRLLTLVGTSGTGKSRLACFACSQVQEQFGTCYYINFESFLGSSQSNELFFIDFVMNQLGLPKVPGPQCEKLFWDFWEAKHALVVLDHFETSIPFSGFLSKWLKLCPQTKLLVVSQEKTNLPEETSFSLKQLSTMQEYKGHIPDALAFLLQGNPEESQTDFQRQELLRLAEKVGGHPEILHTICDWLKTRTLEEVVILIEKQMQESSVQQVFHASWDMLFQEQKQVLFHLSFLEKQFSAASAMAFASTSTFVLGTLVEQGWLQPVAETQSYFLHELRRHYIRQKLEHESNKMEEMEAKFISYFLQDVWSEKQENQSPFASKQIIQTHRNWNSIQQAFLSAIRQQKWSYVQYAIPFMNAYARFTGENILWLELLQQLDQTAETIQGFPTKLQERIQCHKLRLQILVSPKTSDYLLKLVQDFPYQDPSHENYGMFLLASGWANDTVSYEKSLEYFQQAADWFLEKKNEEDHAYALYNLTNTLKRNFQYEEALPLLETSLAIFQRLQNPHGTVFCLLNSIEFHVYHNHAFEQAIAQLDQYYFFSQIVPNREHLAIYHLYQATIKKQQGLWSEAEKNFRFYYKLYTPFGRKYLLAANSYMLSSVLEEQGKIQEAYEITHDRLSFFLEQNNVILLRSSLAQMARNQYHQGHELEQFLYYFQASSMFFSLESSFYNPLVFISIAYHFMDQQEYALAFPIFQLILGAETCNPHPNTRKKIIEHLRLCFENLSQEEIEQQNQKDHNFRDVLELILLHSTLTKPPNEEMCHFCNLNEHPKNYFFLPS